MPAIVDAVVKLSVGGTGDVPDLPDWNDGKISPEEKEVLEEIKNGNVIVGNWEVQAYYIGARDITAISNTFTTSDKITEIKGRMTTFLNGFGYAFYHEAWNLFSDEIMHYKEGDLYRTENVNIWDDVTGFGSGQFGNGGSSVLETNAAKNILDKTSYTYNSGGYPYMAKDLDSIDVDFVPDAGFYNSEKYYRFQNWDLQLGYGNASIRYVNKDTTYNTHPFIGVGTIKTTQQNGGQNYAAWPDHLRSHATLNFGNPYPERARYEKTHPKDRDILWTRIESEPMLNSPDNPDGSDAEKHIFSHLKGGVGMRQFSSVR